MDKRWIYKDTAPTDVASQFSKALNIEEPIAQLLMQRGIKTVEEAEVFFHPDLSKLHDPFLMKDMDIAVERIYKALKFKEKIMVFGDYDVDGTSAVALIYSFLNQFVDREYLYYYIPDRYAEGYGVSIQSIEYAKDNNYSLMIVLDCGIKAFEACDLAKLYKIDVIICDHHRADTTLPKACAILDPKREDCSYPFTGLSGCGVGFKLVQGFCKKYKCEPQKYEQYLDLVTLSIASDIVPITGENRILSYYGLKIINLHPRIGINAIFEKSGIRKTGRSDGGETVYSKKIDITDLVFCVGPRINAAGRIDTGRNSVHLLICDTEEIADDKVAQIIKNNNERKELDKIATEKAFYEIENSEALLARKSIVVYNRDWHKGVIGIVASRLAEKFYKPVVVLTGPTNGLITGSVRSVKGFDVYNAIDSCSDLLEFFGGHKYAAGLSLKEENLEAFKTKFEEMVQNQIEPDSLIPQVEVDMEISLSEINPNFIKNIKRLAPFGPGNMNPVFVTKKVVDDGNARQVGQDRNHLKLNILYPNKSGAPVDAIGFNLGDYFEIIKDKKLFDIAYHLEENEWNGRINPQINLKDIKPSNN